MWAEKGGLDFEGRARWDAWAAVKVEWGCWMGRFWMNCFANDLCQGLVAVSAAAHL